MGDLSTKKCVPCQGGVPPIEEEKRVTLLAELDDWSIVDAHHLTKTYSFSNFTDGLAWVNRMAEIAEEEGHHPDVFLSWGKVQVDIWTHKIDNLTESDFILAAKYDAAFLQLS